MNQSIVQHLLLRKRRSQSMISLLLFLAFVNKCEHEELFFYDKGFFSCILSIEIIISLSRMMLSFCSFSILILYVLYRIKYTPLAFLLVKLSPTFSFKPFRVKKKTRKLFVIVFILYTGQSQIRVCMMTCWPNLKMIKIENVRLLVAKGKSLTLSHIFNIIPTS